MFSFVVSILVFSGSKQSVQTSSRMIKDIYVKGNWWGNLYFLEPLHFLTWDNWDLFIEALLSVLVTLLLRVPFSCVGVLSDIHLEVPPLQEVVHPFSVYFLVPGDYSLQASSVIIDATDVLRARAKAESPDEPILCRGSPFHIRVVGTA
jgi:hypothetical protein